MSKKPVLDTFNIIRTRSRSNPKEANVSRVTSRFRAKLATAPNVSLALAEKMAESGGQKVVAKMSTDPGKTKPPAASTSASLGGTKTSPPGQRVDKPGKPKEREPPPASTKLKPPASQPTTASPPGGKRTIPPGQRDGGSGETERGTQRTAHDSPEPPPDPPGGLGELSAGMDGVQRRLLIDITAAMEKRFGEMKELIEAEMAKIPDLVAEKFDERWREEKETLRQDMAALDTRLSLSMIRLQGDMTDQIKLNGELKESLAAAQVRIGELEELCTDSVGLLVGIVDDREKEQEWREDQDSRGRRCNVRVHGLKEGEEGGDVKKFMEDFIKGEFPELRRTDLKIQRCHRQLGPTEGRKGPRSVVMNFQEFTTREAVLMAAWAKKGLSYNGQFLSFSYDYPPAVYKRIKLYKGLPKYLKEQGLKGKTDYLGRMKVTWTDRSTTTYKDAAAVREGLAERKYVGMPDPPPAPNGRRPEGAFQRVMKRRTTQQEQCLEMKRRAHDIWARKYEGGQGGGGRRIYP